MSSEKQNFTIWSFGLFLILSAGLIIPKVSGVVTWPAIFSDPVAVAGYFSLAAAFIFFKAPRIHIPGIFLVKSSFRGYAIAGAALFICIHYSAGFLLNCVALTPYDLSPLGVLKNLFIVLSTIVAVEMVRGYLIGVIHKSNRFNAFGLIMITLIFGIIQLNFNKLLNADNMQSFFVYACRELIPSLTQSGLLTCIIYYGGVSSAILYAGVVKGFSYIFPFLPDLPWVAESAFGFAFPIIMIIFLCQKYQVLSHKHSAQQDSNIVAFSLILSISVAFLWFVVGVFPIYPSVVLTGSMEPEILPGDIVLIKKITDEEKIYELKENQIINFDREDINITHRIVSKNYDEEGNVSFETKGDNNKSPDEDILLPNDINGTVYKVVPKLGLPVIFFYSNENPEGVVN